MVAVLIGHSVFQIQSQCSHIRRDMPFNSGFLSSSAFVGYLFFGKCSAHRRTDERRLGFGVYEILVIRNKSRYVGTACGKVTEQLSPLFIIGLPAHKAFTSA